MVQSCMKIILKGEPLSVRGIYRSVCRGSFPTIYLSPKGKSVKEDYGWQAKSQWKGKPLECGIELKIDLYFGTKRRCDWDNFHKLSMDALTGIVWVDDSQIQKAIVTKGYDKDNPRIEIEIL